MTLPLPQPTTAFIDGTNCFVDANNFALVVDPLYTGLYRFLQDHYVQDTIIPRGTIKQMFDWLPTPNVDPVDDTAVQYFYYMGPMAGYIIQTSYPPTSQVPPPTTFWQQVSPKVWGLTGLGSDRGRFPLIEYPNLGAT